MLYCVVFHGLACCIVSYWIGVVCCIAGVACCCITWSGVLLCMRWCVGLHLRGVVWCVASHVVLDLDGILCSMMVFCKGWRVVFCVLLYCLGCCFMLFRVVACCFVSWQEWCSAVLSLRVCVCVWTTKIAPEVPGTLHTPGNISTCENNPKFVILNKGQQVPFLILFTWYSFMTS